MKNKKEETVISEMPEIEKIIITKKEGGWLFGISNETGLTEIYFSNTPNERYRISTLITHWLENVIYSKMDGGN